MSLKEKHFAMTTQTIAYHKVKKPSSLSLKPKDSIYTAISNAQLAFIRWKAMKPQYRYDLLQKIATIIWVNKNQLAEIITFETGKIIAQAKIEIESAAGVFDFYAAYGRKTDTKLKQDEMSETITPKAALGVHLGVISWSLPFYQVACFAAPNLLAGNTILANHSPIVPQCAEAIERLFKQAEAPKGLYTNLHVSPHTLGAVTADKRIKGFHDFASNKFPD
jgi:succinate-semialdehyde dehydrogenase / glutarate-semialdehyde dehydrogenase